ncbi:B3 domain-containing transcription factor VAL3-like isoform X2 [Bidens hawaiensis]|uniref:B3 domain-containing transcription factor VAL3-like isoform X2 n=1 Tax=Bidens hawaiensis TaxID=980011 RepID=UPI00404A25BF
MFEKQLTAGDIDHKDGSIVIPNKYAEAYLPEVYDPHGIPLYVVDDEINEWHLRFHFGLNNMYVLDGLKEYMVSNKLKQGDTLAFSRLIPDGPYAIGFKKTSTKKSSRKASARRGKQQALLCG